MFTVKFTCPNDMQVLLGEGYEIGRKVLDNLDTNVDLIEFEYSCKAGCIVMTNWESVYIIDANGISRLVETKDEEIPTLWMDRGDGSYSYWGLKVYANMVDESEYVSRYSGVVIGHKEYEGMNPLYDCKPEVKFKSWKSFLELCDFIDAEKNGIRYDHVAEHVWDNCKHMIKGW